MSENSEVEIHFIGGPLEGFIDMRALDMLPECIGQYSMADIWVKNGKNVAEYHYEGDSDD